MIPSRLELTRYFAGGPCPIAVPPERRLSDSIWTAAIKIAVLLSMGGIVHREVSLGREPGGHRRRGARG
jgi:hypothetical protein